MAAESSIERKFVAYHEAAHAVIALELGDGLLDIGIDLDRVDATGGLGNVGCRLFVADLNELGPSEIETEQRRLAGRIDCTGTVLAAGAASDARLRDEDPWDALRKQGGDYDRMRDLLKRAHLDATPEMIEAHLHQQLDLAVQALKDPQVWRAVETVAGAAIDRTRLTGTEIEALVKPILELG